MKGSKRSFLFQLCLGLLVMGAMQAGEPVQAQEFHIYGLRAMGMGGAGVAAVRDASAIYWNPAVQGYFKRDDGDYEAEYSSAGTVSTFQIGLHQHEEFGSVVNDILNSDIDSLMDDPEAYLLPGGVPNFAAASNYMSVYNSLTDFLLENPGVSVSITSGILANFRNFGLGVIVLGEVGAATVADLENIGIYDTAGERSVAIAGLQALAPPGPPNQYFTALESSIIEARIEAISSDWAGGGGAGSFVNVADSAFALAPPGSKEDAMEALYLYASAVSAPSFTNNQSMVVSQGAVIGEVPLSFGYAINKYVSVGANLKLLYAFVSSMSISVQDAESDDYLNSILDNTETAYSFGIDLGVYGRWKRLRAGILARNINAPSFDYPSVSNNFFQPLKESFTLSPQVRAGLAYLLFDSLVLALDLDLTDNDSFYGELPGGGDYSSRNISFGAEWTPKRILHEFLSVRLGGFSNLSSSDIPIVLTGGLGINLWAFHMDIGGAVSTTTDEITGIEDVGDVTWPTYANLGLAFSMVF